MFGRCLHGFAHGGNIRVESCSDVLYVKDQCVDFVQHFLCRSTRLTVQTEDLQAGRLIGRVADLRDVQFSFEAMFGAEQSRQRNVGGLVQQCRGTDTVISQSRVVCDQANSLTCQ